MVVEVVKVLFVISQNSKFNEEMFQRIYEVRMIWRTINGEYRRGKFSED